MNAYDFDNTILRGDSTRLFYVYCLARTPRMLLRLPALAVSAAFVLARDKRRFKQGMFAFLNDLDGAERMVDAFWHKHKRRVKRFYLDARRPDDVIASASPEFLLRPLLEQLGVTNLIASQVDSRTGLYAGENCYGHEKLRRFRERFGDAEIDEFYSDSLSDAPLAGIARKAYIVKGERVLPWPGE